MRRAASSLGQGMSEHGWTWVLLAIHKVVDIRCMPPNYSTIFHGSRVCFTDHERSPNKSGYEKGYSTICKLLVLGLDAGNRHTQWLGWAE